MRKEDFTKYKNYIESVSPALKQAERTISDIKTSAQWKRAYNYMQCLYTRGYLKERPTTKNGYKIELRGQIIDLEDISDILTPEQIKAIKERQSFK